MTAIVTRLEKIERRVMPKAQTSEICIMEAGESPEDCLRRVGKWPSAPDAVYWLIQGISPDPNRADAGGVR